MDGHEAEGSCLLAEAGSSLFGPIDLYIVQFD